MIGSLRVLELSGAHVAPSRPAARVRASRCRWMSGQLGVLGDDELALLDSANDLDRSDVRLFAIRAPLHARIGKPGHQPAVRYARVYPRDKWPHSQRHRKQGRTSLKTKCDRYSHLESGEQFTMSHKRMGQRTRISTV